MLITGAFLFPMAGYAASASPHLKLHMHRRCVSKECLPPHSSVIRMQRSSHQISRVPQLSARNPCEFNTSSFINAKVNPCPKNRPVKIYCLGTLVNSDGASVFEWVPVVDQALLMASIFLTHMAGVLPAKRSLLSSQNGIPNDRGLSGDSLLPGRDTAVYEKVNLKLHWDIVEEKLMDALSAIEDGSNSGSRYAKFEESSVERPLSLYAIAEAARFRLLWASFRWLKQEVDNISGRAATVSINDWSIIIRGVIQKSCQPIFMAWLEKELSLTSMKVDKELPSVIDEKLTRDDSILRNIRNSGKEDLYAELAQFLVFGSLREGCCYDGNLFIQHGVSMLEDFVITLADGVASVYVELISVDSNMSNEINFTDLILCNLSTRELQKLRNEVALNQWLHQNMKAVISMYEDRFDLCTLQSQVIEESKNETEKFSWWKKLTRGKSAAISSPLSISVISYISVTVKRTKELRALTGWRYYFSLFLELADITMPLIRTLFAKVSDAISFLLVCLIGRSLGLIYTGIRQSLRWK